MQHDQPSTSTLALTHWRTAGIIIIIENGKGETPQTTVDDGAGADVQPERTTKAASCDSTSKVMPSSAWPRSSCIQTSRTWQGPIKPGTSAKLRVRSCVSSSLFISST